LNPDKRAGASTYLEVFLLIGVAVAGSAVVLEAGLRSVASAQGASVMVTEGSIRQGAYFAVETLLVQNTGDVPFASFEVVTGGVSKAASFCYTLYDPISLSTVLTSCPVMAPNPAAVSVSAAVPPGRGLIVELTVMGQAFPPGSVSTVTVTTSAGSQGSFTAVAVPA